MLVLSALVFYSGSMELDALDLQFTICLDGTNELHHNNNHHRFLTAWTTGSRRTAAHLYAADTQSAFHQAFGAGLAFNRNFFCQDPIIRAEFHGTGKQNSMRYLCAFGWTSIIPRIRWRFYLRFVRARHSRNGGPGPPNSTPHPEFKGTVIVVMNGMI